MPVHIPSLTRRGLLRGAASLAGGLIFLDARQARAADPNRWALLSDTHVAADPATVLRKVNMADHLKKVVAEVLAVKAGHAGALINGDCAVTAGLPGDYETLLGLLKPLGAAGMPVHATLGNHDHRPNFRTARVARTGDASLESKHVTVIEGPRANWFLLDSLDQVNVTPGLLGEAQLKWLAAALDARPSRAAMVMVHHHPLFLQPGNRSGVVDTDEMMKVLTPRPQVKALFYGHVHHWDVRKQDRLHVVGLPPVSYPFQAADPSGWVDLTLDERGAGLEMRSVDPAHAAHGAKVRLDWAQA